MVTKSQVWGGARVMTKSQVGGGGGEEVDVLTWSQGGGG